MPEGPAETLAHVWEHFDYYAVMKAVVWVDLGERNFTVRLEHSEAHRTGEFENSMSPGRRYFQVGEDTLWVDRSSKNGKVTETEPWFSVPGEVPHEILSVKVELGVKPDV